MYFLILLYIYIYSICLPSTALLGNCHLFTGVLYVPFFALLDIVWSGVVFFGLISYLNWFKDLFYLFLILSFILFYPISIAAFLFCIWSLLVAIVLGFRTFPGSYVFCFLLTFRSSASYHIPILLRVLINSILGTVGKYFFLVVENYDVEFIFRSHSSDFEFRAIQR